MSRDEYEEYVKSWKRYGFSIKKLEYMFEDDGYHYGRYKDEYYRANKLNDLTFDRAERITEEDYYDAKRKLPVFYSSFAY